MRKLTKVFISSPYSGNEEENVRIQQECANKLINLGYNPFIPLLYHYQQLAHPQPYEKWLEIDLQWIESCEYVLSLPGASPGADREVEHANRLGKPVFYSIENMLGYDNADMFEDDVEKFLEKV